MFCFVLFSISRSIFFKGFYTCNHCCARLWWISREDARRACFLATELEPFNHFCLSTMEHSFSTWTVSFAIYLLFLYIVAVNTIPYHVMEESQARMRVTYLLNKAGRDDKETTKLNQTGKQVQCEEWFRWFSNRGNCARHKKRTHDRVHRAFCPSCKKGFVFGSEYVRHCELLHAIRRPHGCEFCCASFSQESCKARHVNTQHSSERRTFGKSSSLSVRRVVVWQHHSVQLRT